MNFYAIQFPASTTLIVKSKCSEKDLLHCLKEYSGIKAASGTIYNPLQFLSIEKLSIPSDRQVSLALDLKEALV